jgi:hypothetical protein
MPVNRFSQMFAEPAAPAPSQQVGVPVGFAICPVFIVQLQALQQLSAMQDIYRQAYEQAQAKARITRLEKRFFSVWN